MLTLLLMTAISLGLLAFFEPCTIATHTLYAVRLNQSLERKQPLLILWLSRTILLVLLFSIAVFLFDIPQWGKFTPSIILTAIAAVYLVSRLVYIPIPHLAFYKLIPSKSIPMSLQLGLTLPACTLPLIVVITGIAVTLGSLASAVIAGVLFAFSFTLPMFITVFKGVNEKTKQLLSQTANTSPYITAVLLLALAIYLLMPVLRSHADLLEQSLQTASWSGIIIAFIAGFVFSFNPVSFASVPVMLAYVSKSHHKRKGLILAGAFIMGLITTHIVLGIVAAFGGEWVQQVMGREWDWVLGSILIIMGLMWSGLVKIRLPWFGMKAHKVNNLWGAFLLGIPFSIAICPFCTPALMVTLTASAAIGSVPFGGALLFSFALGRSIPVALGAFGMGWLENFKILSKHQRFFEVLAGVLLVLAGLYVIRQYYAPMEF